MSKPDPRKSLFVFISGRKGSGKSHLARTWFDSYPYDRVVLDVTHDLRDDLRRDGVEFAELQPGMMPGRLSGRADPDDRRPQTWLFAPDVRSPTWQDDADRVVGLSMTRGAPVLLWVDEFGAISRANRTGPNMHAALHHGRHANLSLLLCCPRPVDVHPLGIGQADIVSTFRTQQIYDRQRIADTIGEDRGRFDEANEQLGPFEYTTWDGREQTPELVIMPALPARPRGLASLPAPDDLTTEP